MSSTVQREEYLVCSGDGGGGVIRDQCEKGLLKLKGHYRLKS